jgi:hypothetical protein
MSYIISKADRQIVLTIDNFRKGASAPTDVTIGTTPTVPGLRFAATNELLSALIMLPFNVDTTVPIEIIFIWSLVSSETNSDTLDVTMDYNIIKAASTGDGLAKTSTQLTETTTVTTANGLAAGDIYAMIFSLDPDDADNPIEESSSGVAVEIHLTNITGVASADLVAACVNYKATY